MNNNDLVTNTFIMSCFHLRGELMWGSVKPGVSVSYQVHEADSSPSGRPGCRTPSPWKPRFPALQRGSPAGGEAPRCDELWHQSDVSRQPSLQRWLRSRRAQRRWGECRSTRLKHNDSLLSFHLPVYSVWQDKQKFNIKVTWSRWKSWK